jgi:hypothetical protein
MRHLISRASRKRCQPLPGQTGKFNLISTLLAPSRPPFGAFGGWKSLTLQGMASIRAAMAAGAIPPPLFFERRRYLDGKLAERMEKHHQRRSRI